MKVVFCGTPSFAVPTLERLLKDGFVVSLVVTQPDRPRGRGMEVSDSPVKAAAHAHHIPIVQPDQIKSNREFQGQLKKLAPEAIVIVGYGRIVPQWMLDLPPLGNINLHASLLPRYRGAAPIQWAIANGETVTGNTTMRIDSGLDTGDILLQEQFAIDPGDTAVTLAPRLAASGAELIVKTLRGLRTNSIQPIPQDHAQASLAPILKKNDGRIDFTRTAQETINRMRGFRPWPGAFTLFRGKTCNLHAAVEAEGQFDLAQGTLAFRNGHLLVGCGKQTTLEILELQLEGKRRMTAREFANGNRLTAAETLGT